MTVRGRLLLIFALTVISGVLLLALVLVSWSLGRDAADQGQAAADLQADCFDLNRLVDELADGNVDRIQRQWALVMTRVQNRLGRLIEDHPENVTYQSMRAGFVRAGSLAEEVWSLPADVSPSRRRRLTRTLLEGLSSSGAAARSQADLTSVRARSINRTAGLIQALFMMLLILGNGWLVIRARRTLSRGLEVIGDGLDRYAAGDLTHVTRLEAGSGELDRIARDMTDMARSLASITAERDASLLEIRQHRDHLQELVAERTHDLEERIKEIRCLFDVSETIAEKEHAAEIFEATIRILPAGMEFPDLTRVRIRFDGRNFATEDFEASSPSLGAEIPVAGRTRGSVEVFRVESDDDVGSPDFLQEEADLVDAIARALGLAVLRLETRQDLAAANAALSRSNEELQQFAYVASHDLQEPLRMVSSFTQLLADRYGDKLDAEAHEFIEFAVDGARRLQQLIRDLLEFSRVQSRSRPFGPVDLAGVMEQVTNNLAAVIAETGAEVTHGQLPAVPGDRGQWVQVLQNLLANAIKFHGEEAPRVHVESVEQGGGYRITVADNGIGIDPKYADRVFTIFQRLHTRQEYEGTGIGLALVKRIIERHGGSVTFGPNEPQGTVFTIHLPHPPGEENDPI